MERRFIYETADKLEQVCKRRKAHDFYNHLKSGEHPLFDITKLNEYAKTHQKQQVRFPEIELTLAKIQNVVFEFYQSLDETMFNKLKNTLQNPFFKHNFKEPSHEGKKNAVGFNYDNKKGISTNGIITLEPENTIYGYIVVAHESGHLLEERNQKLMNQKTDCIGEIASIFTEKLFMDYLYAVGIVTKEEHRLLKVGQENALLRNVNLLLEENEILSQLNVPITGEQLVKLEEKYCGTKRGDVLKNRIETMIVGNGAQEVYGQRMFRYVVGGVVAEALYQDFRKEPQQTLERFKNFLDRNAEMDENEAYQTLLGENYAQKAEQIFQENSKSKE